MNIIYLIDKSKADELLSLGFQYKEKKMQDKTAYEFIGTTELIQILNSKFDNSSFFVSKNMNFSM